MPIRPATHYDKSYFDKWYRHPRHRVKSARDIERQLQFIVSATEYILERQVTSVLDVGAGEGNWSVALKKIRPRAKYYGVDPSEYAVKRYGTSRNIRARLVISRGCSFRQTARMVRWARSLPAAVMAAG